MTETPIECAKNRAYPVVKRWTDALERGEITEADWYRELKEVFSTAYLARENPRAQSGHSGNEEHWRHARSLICDAIDREGNFLDVGCASGYLMECVQRWSADRGLRIEPYGLDISAKLAALARRRLPHWVDRIFIGNAIYWDPPMRFDFVRTGLEYVPPRRGADLLRHLLSRVVAPGGRLIVGTHNEDKEVGVSTATWETKVASWGYRIGGRSVREHFHDGRLQYRVFWIDRDG